jgi:aminomethyltransferase
VKNTDIDAMFKNSRLKKRNVPIQLRQSGDAGDGGLDGKGSRLLIDCRVRKGPYWHLSQEAGAWCYQVYNKIYHPRAYITPEEGGLMEEYKYLTEHVTMWNVAVERQIAVTGPDATKFVDYVITRRAELCEVEKCKYVILCGPTGGILNDPILLRPHENEWWFSLADSDIGMYLQGVNHDGRWDCDIKEIDVAPVQIQGPKAPALMADVFGEAVTKMKYYDMIHAEVDDWKCVISASGFSTELGYEIYLHDATKNAEKMWNKMLEAGKKHNLKVIAPGHHRRIEAGLLSYGQDIDIEVNPYECGLGWQVDLTKEAFIGKEKLAEVKKNGVTNRIAGLRMGGDPITWYNADFYHVLHQGELVGYVSSAWYSPTQESNIALAMLPVDLTKIGTELEVALPKKYSNSATVKATVEKTPFRQPAKGNEGRGLRQTGSKFDT